MTWKQKRILFMKTLEVFLWDDFYTVKRLMVSYGLVNDKEAMRRYLNGCDRIGLKTIPRENV